MLCTFCDSRRSVKHSLLSLAAVHCLSTFCSSAYLHVCASASVAYDHYFTLGRTESLKSPPNGPVTWPSEQWTSMWKASAHLRT